jgi:small subunit ribosomal protein S13
MYLLGAHLPDHKLVRIALTGFYGISYHVARQLCARLSLHDSATVASLSDAQINQLSAYLSAPTSVPARAASPTSADAQVVFARDAAPSSSSSSAGSSSSSAPLPPSQRASPFEDPLRSIVLEADLRRQHTANIAHHRTVGTYIGRRHVQGLPVRGQRTRRNAQTAKKLNRMERRQYSSYT